MDETLFGKCCFCQEQCNMLSQSCGTCARNITGYSIGINNNLPDNLKEFLYEPHISLFKEFIQKKLHLTEYNPLFNKYKKQFEIQNIFVKE